MVDISDLIHLAKLFKHGFSVEIIAGDIHTGHYRRFYDSIPTARTFIVIHGDKPTYHNGMIPDNCTINGFPVPKKDEYHIEIVEADK